MVMQIRFSVFTEMRNPEPLKMYRWWKKSGIKVLSNSFWNESRKWNLY